MDNEILRTEKLQHNKTGKIRMLVLQRWEDKFIVGFSGFGGFEEYEKEEVAISYFNFIANSYSWSVVQ